MRGLIRAHFNWGNENFKLAPFELLSLKSPFDGHTGDGATNNDLIKVGEGDFKWVIVSLSLLDI